MDSFLYAWPPAADYRPQEVKRITSEAVRARQARSREHREIPTNCDMCYEPSVVSGFPPVGQEEFDGIVNASFLS